MGGGLFPSFEFSPGGYLETSVTPDMRELPTLYFFHFHSLNNNLLIFEDSCTVTSNLTPVSMDLTTRQSEEGSGAKV